MNLGGPISAEPRINDRIRVPEVRLVGPDGQQVGIVAIQDALRLAGEADLDLVEIVPTARPPVAKIMDYGKYKYESALKAREARKNQAHTIIKEMKLRPKIDPHDYETKKGHVVRFLNAGDKVKITIMFRGREQSRPELGRRLLERLAGDVEDLGFVEFAPKQDGRNMIMVLGPKKKKVEAMAEARAAKAAKADAAGGGHRRDEEHGPHESDSVESVESAETVEAAGSAQAEAGAEAAVPEAADTAAEDTTETAEA
jgi:translation initiation factor IF-3